MSNIRARLGAAVKACRGRRRLTQEQLAERSGLSYKFIGEIERGSANPTVETVERLAVALGVELSTLVATASSPHAGGDYQISHRELARMREALESIADVTEKIASVTYPSARRRRR